MSNFPVLKTIALVLTVLGVILVLGGIIGLFLGYSSLNNSFQNAFDSNPREDKGKLIAFVPGAVMILWGLIVMAFGELLHVVLAIEVNTRRKLPRQVKNGCIFPAVRSSNNPIPNSLQLH